MRKTTVSWTLAFQTVLEGCLPPGPSPLPGGPRELAELSPEPELAKPLGAVTNNGTPSPPNPAAARTLGGPRRPSWPPALRILSSRQHQDRLRGPRSTESCRETRAPSRRRRTALGTALGTSTDNQSPAGRNFRRAGRDGAARLGAWEETTSLTCKAESGLACQPPVQSRDTRLSYIPHSRLFPRPQGTMTHIRMSLFGFNEL